MSLGYAINKNIPKHIDLRKRIVTITMDTDYPTGGWTLSAASMGLNGIVAVFPLGQLNGYVAAWDRANGKLMMFFHDYDASADGPLIECTSGLDDLASKTVTLFVLGY